MNLLEELESIRLSAVQEIESAPTDAALETLRVHYLGKTGRISQAASLMRNLTKEERPVVGKALNEVRDAVTAALDLKTAAMTALRDLAAVSLLDVTLPAALPTRGTRHPLTQVQDRVIEIFRRMGFALADGPDIDDEWHCFDALNTPADHPARNESDTFYLPDGRLLRTHTSTVQIRTMVSQPPPVRIISPGAAYRRDEVDATHSAQFHQMEGLCVDEGVSLADLKGTVEFFFRELFGAGTRIRFRPHFFPFTEPSYEIDIRHESMGGGRWLEVAGCGLVDPAVFEAVNARRGDDAYGPERVSGWAFGFGMDRVTMLMTGVPDIRFFSENDLRFLAVFGS